MMTAFMLGLAIPYHHQATNHVGFIVMYARTIFFSNFGPNSTTSSCCPRSSRRACAIVGFFSFLYAAQSQNAAKAAEHDYPAGIGVRKSLFVLAVCNLLGSSPTSFACPSPMASQSRSRLQARILLLLWTSYLRYGRSA
nr:unnamed protein product [Digitaria exilis]